MKAKENTSIHILHLEDNETDAFLVRETLQSDGISCKITLVQTREEFADAIYNKKFDIILADANVGAFDGISGIKIASQGCPGTPVIMVSGSLGEEVAIDLLRRGATDYVLKNRLSRLAPAVKRAIEEVRERKKREEAEQSLIRESQKFKALIENSAELICILNQQGQILFVSQSAKRLLNLDPDALIQTPFSHLIHEEDQERLGEFLTNFYKQEENPSSAPYELQIGHQDGSWRNFECIFLNLLKNENVKGIVINGRDVTERKNLEDQFRQSQKMEAVGRLAGGISHDFNNMLLAIMGHVGLLLESQEPSSNIYKSLEEVRDAANRAASLTRQLLLFSRKQAIKPAILDINGVIRDLGKMLSHVIDENIFMVPSLASDLWRTKMDRGQLEQVIMNLVVNARDAMPSGGKLLIETFNMEIPDGSRPVSKYEPAPGRYVSLFVCDTGCGMSPEVKARIFEPFFTTKPTGKGTGLGLSTVYSIVQQYNGRISVESELGKGTVFKILLPASTEAAEPLQEPSRSMGHTRGNETILLVEDDEAARRTLYMILQKKGYQVLKARHGEEALLFCNAHPGNIDLMITDVILPMINGQELADRAKSIRPAMKVLFTSGYTHDTMNLTSDTDLQRSFLQKPFDIENLLFKINESLNRQAGN